jgi:hypothetical protein
MGQLHKPFRYRCSSRLRLHSLFQQNLSGDLHIPRLIVVITTVPVEGIQDLIGMEAQIAAETVMTIMMIGPEVGTEAFEVEAEEMAGLGGIGMIAIVIIKTENGVLQVVEADLEVLAVPEVLVDMEAGGT